MSGLARALPYAAVPGGQTARLPEIQNLPQGRSSEADPDHNGIALWDKNGKLILADRKGRGIPYSQTDGFTGTAPFWQPGSWRILYLHDPATGQTAAVSQSWHERLITLFDTVWGQLATSLIVLPFMIWILHAAINRSLKPPVHPRPRTFPPPRCRSFPRPLPRTAGNPSPRRSPQHPVPTRSDRHRARTALYRLPPSKSKPKSSPSANRTNSPTISAKSSSAPNTSSTSSSPSPNSTPNTAFPTHSPSIGPPSAAKFCKTPTLPPSKNASASNANSPTTPCRFPATTNFCSSCCATCSATPRAIPPKTAKSCCASPRAHRSARPRGVGIAPQHLSKIKECFYRPADQNKQGSRLGLSIVEQITKLHGLAVRLENRNEGRLSVWMEKM
ncbi:ATP-binding protein [Neisseria chenwenguii]|uniref:ATP-binding protein n=1 Tax=Neisseria chenwenguii TaxID=1853278 RepID=UPI000F50EDA4|nr:ATP-binding protein [Neisseria chenwenguii]ROV56987.1 hypothetical protein EGS38_02235 [Neisseria chenwenguii]